MQDSKEKKLRESLGGRAYAAAMDDKLSFREKLCYGAGDFTQNIIGAGVVPFLNNFYTNFAGLGAAAVGMVMMLSRFLDGISDFICGAVVDRTKHPMGKTRPWLLWMAAPFALSLPLLFWSPDASIPVKLAYAFVTYNLVMSVTFTFTQIPYGALLTLMTQNPWEREQLSMYRMIPNVICAAACSACTLPMVQFFGNDVKAWSITYLIYGVVAGGGLLLACFGTRERVPPPPKEKLARGETLRSVKALFRNKYWVMQATAKLLEALDTISNTVMMYYLIYVLKQPALIGIMAFSFIPSALVLAFVTPFCLKKFGKRNSVLIHSVAAVGMHLVLAVCYDSMVIWAVVRLLKTGFIMLFQSATYPMISEAAEYGEWKTGVRNEAMVFSAASIGRKIGQGVGAGVAGLLLGAAGFVSSTSNSAVQPLSAVLMVKNLYLWSPIIINAIIFVIFLFWDLDKKYDGIVAELKRRREQHT